MVGDALTCPRCGTIADTLAGSVPVDGTERRLRVPVDCSACSAPLALVVERTTTLTADDEPREETDDGPREETNDGAQNETGDRPREETNDRAQNETGDRPHGQAGDGSQSRTDADTRRVGVELWLEDRRGDG